MCSSILSTYIGKCSPPQRQIRILTTLSLTLSYSVFASLNAFIIPVVYFFFPETAGRSLEDMDVIFALAHNEGVSPVKVSLRKDVPPAGSPEADAILGIERPKAYPEAKANAEV